VTSTGFAAALDETDDSAPELTAAEPSGSFFDAGEPLPEPPVLVVQAANKSPAIPTAAVAANVGRRCRPARCDVRQRPA
jgi:hypothetical protein